jgi:serine protease Do
MRRAWLPALLPALAVQAALLLLLTAGCKKPQRLGAQPEPRTEDIPSGATEVPNAPALVPPAPSPASSGPSAEPHAYPMSFAPIARRADPSVVLITTVEEEAEVSPFTHRIIPHESRGLGSGFVIDKSGIILTNAHVVSDAHSILVKLSDEREFPAKVIGADPMPGGTDIAVIRIDAHDLRPLSFGDSDALEVGDWVVAIGNPYALSHTVSAGIVSAKGRTTEDVELDPAGYYNFLQTDASINPGNSGGPLLDLKGEVVGINSAIKGGGAQNIGFAIPINMVKQLLPMLERDGHVTRSALGVAIADARKLTPEGRRTLGIGPAERLQGAIITGVAPGAGADKAGLQAGDIIVAFEGQPIERSAQLRWLVSVAGVGRTVTLRVQRGEKTFEIKVTLGALPQNTGR